MSISLENLKANTFANVELVLKKLPGEKYMLIEPVLLRAMDRTVSMRVLYSLGVKKVFKIQELPPGASFSKLVYVISPTRQSVQVIIDHTKVDRESQIKRNRLVAFVPKQTAAVKALLESQGFLGNDLQIADFSFGWIPVDVDLISLNLPEIYSNYFIYGDTAWPYHFGHMLGQVLQTVLPIGHEPTSINLHAFGSAAQVSAAGLSSAINQLKASKSSANSEGQDSSASAALDRPLFVLFSRNLDYITPLMVPTTFEALIHEVIGIDNGVVDIPNAQKNDMVPSRLNLSSSNIGCFKDVRDAHISTVHKWLQDQRSRLEDSRTGLGFSLAALDQSGPGSDSGPQKPSVASLTDLSSQLKPILTVRKELTVLFICLEEVMRKMANEERVEDLLAAQTAILQSGSGGALAMPTASSSSSFTISKGPVSSSQQEAYEPMPAEAATGTCASDPTCQPVRLSLEWLSTKFGDRLTEAVRLLCLLTVTHDGLSEELYNQVIRHIQHAVGFSIYPMLVALRRLRLLYARRHRDAPQASGHPSAEEAVAAPSRSAIRLGLAPSSVEKLANATDRLIKRRKSTYNQLHRQLLLSMRSQVNLSVDTSAVSPSYVFGGHHVPVVVRLAESLWANGLAGVTNFGRSLLNEPELLTKDQLSRALTFLHIDERSAKTLGRVVLAPHATTGQGGSNANVEEGWRTRSHGQTVVVAFVGGCTYAEVAALRFAAVRRCWRLLIATSQILSTKSLIHQVGQAAAL